MKIYPAIDLKDGQCVRLRQGDFNRTTIFSTNPAEQAKQWEKAGSSFLHVVDLDGAKSGHPCNNKSIKNILSAVSIPIQTGGGIRTIEDIEEKINMGVSRVVLGTTAVKNLSVIRIACKKFGADRIAVGVDAKDGLVAISAWADVEPIPAIEFCLRLKEIGIKTIIFTDVAKDGMMQGPNVKATAQMIEQTELEVIGSGGVSSLHDLENLAAAGAAGAIIGQALYIGAIDLSEAVKRFEN